MVPIGPPLIWGGATAWLAYQDQTGWAVFMAVYGFVVISGIDNVIKPLLISRGSSLGFALVFLGVMGGVYAFGGAPYLGSLPGLGVVPALPVVGITSTPSGNGYWLVGADGGVYAFGDAAFHGSAPGSGGTPSPVVGLVATPGGTGYWLLTADGHALPFGDAAAEAPYAHTAPVTGASA